MAPQTLSQLRARIALGASSLIGVQGYLTGWYWQRSIRAGEDVPLLAALTQRCCVHGGKFFGTEEALYRNASCYGARRDRPLAGKRKRCTLPGSYFGSKAEPSTWQTPAFPLSALLKQQSFKHNFSSFTCCTPVSSISQRNLCRPLLSSPLDLSKPLEPRSVSTLSSVFSRGHLTAAAESPASMEKPDGSAGDEDAERRALSKEAGVSGRSSEAALSPKKAGSAGRRYAPTSKESEPPWLDQPQKRTPMDPPFLYRASTAGPKAQQSQLRGLDTNVRGMHMQTKAEGKDHSWGLGSPRYAAARWFSVPLDTLEALEQWERTCQELASTSKQSKLMQSATRGGTQGELLSNSLDLEPEPNWGLSDSLSNFQSSAAALERRGERERSEEKHAVSGKSNQKAIRGPKSGSLTQGEGVSEMTTVRDLEAGFRAASRAASSLQTSEAADCRQRTSISSKFGEAELDSGTSTQVRRVGSASEEDLSTRAEGRGVPEILGRGAEEERACDRQESLKLSSEIGQTEAPVQSKAAKVCHEQEMLARGDPDKVSSGGALSTAEAKRSAQQEVALRQDEEKAGVSTGNDANESQEVLKEMKGAEISTLADRFGNLSRRDSANTKGAALQQQHLKGKKKDEDSGVEQKQGREEVLARADVQRKQLENEGKGSSTLNRRGRSDGSQHANGVETWVDGRGIVHRVKGRGDQRSAQDTGKQGEGRRGHSGVQGPQPVTLGGKVESLSESLEVESSRRLSWAELIASTQADELGPSADEVSGLSESSEANSSPATGPQQLSWADLIAPAAAYLQRQPLTQKLSWEELMQPVEEQPAAVNGLQGTTRVVDSARTGKRTRRIEVGLEKTSEVRAGGRRVLEERRGVLKDQTQRMNSELKTKKTADVEKGKQPAAVDVIQGTTRAVDGPASARSGPQALIGAKELQEARAKNFTEREGRQTPLEDRARKKDSRVKSAERAEVASAETGRAEVEHRAHGKPQISRKATRGSLVSETRTAGVSAAERSRLEGVAMQAMTLQKPLRDKLASNSLAALKKASPGMRPDAVNQNLTKEALHDQPEPATSARFALWEEWHKGKNEIRDEMVRELAAASSLGAVQWSMYAYKDDVMPKDALQIMQALRAKGQLVSAYHFHSWANAQPALAANRFLLAQALPIAAEIGRLGEVEQLLFTDLSACRGQRGDSAEFNSDRSPEIGTLFETGASYEKKSEEGAPASALGDGSHEEEAGTAESDRAPLLADTFLCNSLLEAYLEQGRWQEALGVFDRMQAPRRDHERRGSSGKDAAVLVGVDGEDRNGERREGEGSESESSEGQIVREDYGWLEETFQTWMHQDVERRRGLKNWKDGLHLELPRGMSVSDVLGPKDVFSFNLAMRACLRGHLEFAHVWALRDAMEREGLVPDLASYNLTIAACCKLPEGSAHFNARARAEDALLLLDEMQQRGHSPNVHTYTAALSAWAQANTAVARALGRAESTVMVSVFERMLHEGERPNAVTYGALVAGFTKMGALEDAELAVEDMLGAGILPNQGVVNAFLAGCELGGEFGRARKWVEGLQSCSLETQTRLLSVRVNTGGAGTVVEACEKLRGLGRSYIEGMRELRSEVAGTEVAVKQRQLNESPAEPLKEASSDDMAVSMELLDAQVEPDNVQCDDTALYKILVQALVKAGRFEALAPVLQEMAQRQCSPDLVTYNVVMDVCSRNENWEITDQIVEALGQIAASVAHVGGLGTAGDRDTKAFDSTLRELVDPNGGAAVSSWHAASVNLPPAFLAAASELLATQFSDDDVKTRAQNLMTTLRARGEPPKSVLAFFSSLCDALWTFGWEKRVSLVAGSLLGPGFQRGFKDRRRLSSATDREWSLDVRRLGKGAGQAILMLWLSRAREEFLAGERPPMKVAIVTGYGGRKWGRGELNEVVGELLRSLGSPFLVTGRNPGRHLANGYEVYEWLMEDGMEAKLALSDGTSSVEEEAAEAF